MRIDNPSPDQIPGLRLLWKLAFGDTDAFLDTFFGVAFSPDRCRCVSEGEKIVGALYWFRCELEGQKFAYLYAVATHPEHRRKGICRALLEDTHAHLSKLGYGGVILVPQEEPLRNMYRAAGYQNFGCLREFPCASDPFPSPIHTVDPDEYARLRRKFLPAGGVIQEDENLTFLSTYARFYAGPTFLLAACPEGDKLRGLELLGDSAAAPGILRALGYAAGTFRTPGGTAPFAMFLPLNNHTSAPAYFALALD